MRHAQRHQGKHGSVFWILANVALLLAIIMSAFLLVYLKDRYRRSFINYQQLLNTSNSMQVEYGKLLLEESTWASASRVQHLAQTQLKMQVPSTKQIKIIRLDNKEI